MSFLISDSLVGLVDENTLMGGVESLGEAQIDNDAYVVDAFIADSRTMRFHVIANHSVALDLLSVKDKIIKLRLGKLNMVGQLLQVGWDDTPRGGRVILCMTRKIDNN